MTCELQSSSKILRITEYMNRPTVGKKTLPYVLVDAPRIRPLPMSSVVHRASKDRQGQRKVVTRRNPGNPQHHKSGGGRRRRIRRGVESEWGRAQYTSCSHSDTVLELLELLDLRELLPPNIHAHSYRTVQYILESSLSMQ